MEINTKSNQWLKGAGLTVLMEAEDNGCLEERLIHQKLSRKHYKNNAEPRC